MSSPGSNPMDAVSALMQERQRFEAWIVALEEKRAITPPHVYERVRGDYEVRLKEFVSGIANRGGTILFVGTKKQARDSIKEAATKERAGAV